MTNTNKIKKISKWIQFAAIVSLISSLGLVGCSPDDKKLNRFSGSPGGDNQKPGGDKLKVFPTGSVVYLSQKQFELAQLVMAITRADSIMPRSLQMKGNDIVPGVSSIVHLGGEGSFSGHLALVQKDEGTASWIGDAWVEEARAGGDKNIGISRAGFFARRVELNYQIKEGGILVNWVSEGIFAGSYEGKRYAQEPYKMEIKLIVDPFENLKFETISATLNIRGITNVKITDAQFIGHQNLDSCIVWSGSGRWFESKQIESFEIQESGAKVGGYTAKNLEAQCSSDLLVNPLVVFK